MSPEQQAAIWVQNAETNFAVAYGSESNDFADCSEPYVPEAGPFVNYVAWIPGWPLSCTLFNADGSPLANSQGVAYCAMAVVMLPDGRINVPKTASGTVACYGPYESNLSENSGY